MEEQALRSSLAFAARRQTKRSGKARVAIYPALHDGIEDAKERCCDHILPFRFLGLVIGQATLTSPTIEHADLAGQVINNQRNLCRISTEFHAEKNRWECTLFAEKHGPLKYILSVKLLQYYQKANRNLINTISKLRALPFWVEPEHGGGADFIWLCRRRWIQSAIDQLRVACRIRLLYLSD